MESGQADPVLAVAHASDERARRRAFEVLAAMDEPSLTAAFESCRPDTLERVADTAVEVGDESALSVCRTLLGLSDERIDRTAIVDRLLAFSRPEAVDVVLDGYRLGTDDERVAIARSLSGQLTPDLAGALAAAARDDDGVEPTVPDPVPNTAPRVPPDVDTQTFLDETFRRADGIRRRAAALGLGVLGTEQALEPLVESLEADETDRRRDALGGVSVAPPELAVEPLATVCREGELVAVASELLREALDRLNWDEHLVDSVGRQVVDAMLAVEDDGVRSTLLHAIHDAVRADVYRDDDDVFAVLANAARLPDPGARAQAATLLALTEREAAIEPILALFDDPQPEVRASAAQSVVKVGADLGTKFSALLQGTDTYRTAGAYGAIDASAALPALVDLLDDEAPCVRCHAAAALGELGDDRAVEPLVWVLEADPDPVTRRNAADALGRIGHPAAVDVLRRAIADPDETVRRQAVVASGNPAFERAEELGELLLDHGEPAIRAAAATALANQAPDHALGPLCQALTTESDPSVRIAITDALRTLDEPAALPVLRDARPGDDAVADAIELAIDALDRESAPE